MENRRATKEGCDPRLAPPATPREPNPNTVLYLMWLARTRSVSQMVSDCEEQQIVVYQSLVGKPQRLEQHAFRNVDGDFGIDRSVGVCESEQRI